MLGFKKKNKKTSKQTSDVISGFMYIPFLSNVTFITKCQTWKDFIERVRLHKIFADLKSAISLCLFRVNTLFRASILYDHFVSYPPHRVAGGWSLCPPAIIGAKAEQRLDKSQFVVVTLYSWKYDDVAATSFKQIWGIIMFLLGPAVKLSCLKQGLRLTLRLMLLACSNICLVNVSYRPF